MTTDSSILAWRIPWTEKPGRLQSMGSIHKELGIIHTHNSIHTGSTLMATLPSQIVSLKAITLEMKLQHMGFQFSSVAQSCLIVCDPMDCSTPGLPVHHQLMEFTQTHVHRVMMPSKQCILCRPLFLLPSIFHSIRVFSNESVLCIRWPRYWSFSFSISPSSEY